MNIMSRKSKEIYLCRRLRQIRNISYNFTNISTEFMLINAELLQKIILKKYSGLLKIDIFAFIS